jgi:hypothetical protein
MGGLISHYGGIAMPEIFGKLGIFSPSFAIFDSCYYYTAEQGVDPDLKFYFLAGGMEGGVAARCQQMVDEMLDAGAIQSNLLLHVNPQGMHNEAFWSIEFRDAIEWLFDITSAVDDEQEYKRSEFVQVFPNPVSDVVSLIARDDQQMLTLELFDSGGRRMIFQEFKNAIEFNVDGFAQGLYVAKISNAHNVQVVKIIVGDPTGE